MRLRQFIRACSGAAPGLAAIWIASSAVAQPTTTVIAHGFTTGDKGVWVQAMAEAILARAGEGSLYRYVGSGAGGGVWSYVPTAHSDGTNNTIVLIFNWVPESASPSPGPNWNYLQAAGDALYAMLRSPRFAGHQNPTPNDLVTNRKVHFIGHSRGACVNSEAVKRFALANIPIDHYTALDPHPVNGTLDARYNFDWGDPVPVRWNNIAWADNYWRADGGGLINGLDFDGVPLDNVYNLLLNESALNCCAYGFAHLDVHLWYHGTIDLSPFPCDGEQCINQQMRDTWWPAPGYALSGFYYSVIGGGSANRPAIPAGTAPDPVETIYNGAFSNGTYAGWGYHGGSVAGQIVSDAGNFYLRLGAGQGGASATHNRFYLPHNASAIVVDYRVFTAVGGSEQIHFRVRDEATGVSYLLGWDVPAMIGGWWTKTMPIGCSAQSPPRGRAYTLTLEIVSGGTISSVVGFDNIRYTTGSLAADVTADGVVNVGDMLAVINAWGACPPPCPPSCAADINDDCMVNVSDLLAVINAWGDCL